MTRTARMRPAASMSAISLQVAARLQRWGCSVCGRRTVVPCARCTLPPSADACARGRLSRLHLRRRDRELLRCFSRVLDESAPDESMNVAVTSGTKLREAVKAEQPLQVVG